MGLECLPELSVPIVRVVTGRPRRGVVARDPADTALMLSADRTTQMRWVRDPRPQSSWSSVPLQRRNAIIRISLALP